MLFPSLPSSFDLLPTSCPSHPPSTCCFNTSLISPFFVDAAPLLGSPCLFNHSISSISPSTFSSSSSPSQHAAADFFHPVVAIYPDIEAAYLAVVKAPMDLSTLANYLHENSLIDEEDYFEKVGICLSVCVCLSLCLSVYSSLSRHLSRSFSP